MEVGTLERREAGRSGIELSVLGMGCWMFGGTSDDYWGGHDEDEARNLVSVALERGLNYFDAAEVYNAGRCEEGLGRVLKGRRGEAVIGTKILPENCSKEGVRKHCEASLRRLGTDYIDIYMVHWPVRDYPAGETFAELGRLKEEGKIRMVGVSNYGLKDLTEALATGVEIGINQMHYNLFSRAIETEILPLCREKGIGVLTYMPLLQGILTGKYGTIEEIPANRTRTRHFRGDRPESRHEGPGAEAEVDRALGDLRKLAAETGHEVGQLALAWAAAREGVTCVIAGARNVEQLQANIDGVSLRLADDVIARLDEITDPLYRKLGSNPDYWQSDKNSRIR